MDTFIDLQDCSKDYGYRTIINKIVKINCEEYEEISVDSIEPNWMEGLKELIHLILMKNIQ